MIRHPLDDLAYRRVLWVRYVIGLAVTVGVADHCIDQRDDVSDINGIHEIVCRTDVLDLSATKILDQIRKKIIVSLAWSKDYVNLDVVLSKFSGDCYSRGL